jgi:hypothetical protein
MKVRTGPASKHVLVQALLLVTHFPMASTGGAYSTEQAATLALQAYSWRLLTVEDQQQVYHEQQPARMQQQHGTS